jgi:polygalacturonase
MKNTKLPFLFLLSAVLVLICHAGIGAGVFNVKDYGAGGDGVAMEPEAIQKTMDACHRVGDGTVWVPAGDFQIGTIRLKSNRSILLSLAALYFNSETFQVREK